MRLIEFTHWPYHQALQWMEEERHKVLEGGEMCIAIGEHSPGVITLGRHTSAEQLLHIPSSSPLVHRVNRGGGATAHEPGQIVIYPIFNLEKLRLGVKDMVCLLQRFMVKMLNQRALSAHCRPDQIGVFVGEGKIAAIGLNIHRNVTTHGISINVTNTLELFSLITPCGVANMPLTTLAKELKAPIDKQAFLLNDFKKQLIQALPTLI